MKIVLESQEEIKQFIIRHNNKRKLNADVVINGTVFLNTLIDYEQKMRSLNNKLAFLTTNFVEEAIESNISIYTKPELEEPKTEVEVRKETIASIKEELSSFKAEGLSTDNIIDYTFIFMLYNYYDLEPEVIVEKVEKDLEEIETN